MMKEFPININRIVILSLFMLVLSSCASVKKDEKFYEKQQARMAKQEKREYDKRVKAHEEIQSKETLKMMQETKREVKKLNKSKKR